MEKGEPARIGRVSHVDEALAAVEDEHDTDDEGSARRRCVSVMDHVTSVQVSGNSSQTARFGSSDKREICPTHAPS